MSYTAPTVAQIRARWPAVTSTVCSDSDLEDLRAEAAERVVDGLATEPTVSGAMAPGTLAWLHYSAHLALARRQGGASPVVAVASASYLDRSLSRESSKAPQAHTWAESSLSSTAPGVEYLKLAQTVWCAPVGYGSAW